MAIYEFVMTLSVNQKDPMAGELESAPFPYVPLENVSSCQTGKRLNNSMRITTYQTFEENAVLNALIYVYHYVASQFHY